MKQLRTITDFLNAYDEGALLPEDVADHTARALSAAKLPAAAHCFTHLNDHAPEQAERNIASGSPLGGIAVHVKDVFDVAGQVTTAGSQVLQGQPPASQDATVVSRLKGAGAVILGRSNMTEFAYSGVGINPHYGTPRCAADPLVARIPGGSSSGGAVAVALNIGWAAIGTDTGGSTRIPAALNGIVGWKPTARRVPQQGCYPLAPSLDSVGHMSRSVADTILLDDIIADTPSQWTERTTKAMRFVVPDNLLLDGMDASVTSAFEAAIDALSKAGALIEMVRIRSLDRLPALHALGNLAAFEAYQFHSAQQAAHGYDDSSYDPRVAQRIAAGAGMSAAQYTEQHAAVMQARSAWAASFAAELAPYDALLCPTVPIVAPPLEPLIDSDALFFSTNALLLRNTAVFNSADGCAISLPCHTEGLPVGLMLGHAAMKDGRVLTAARAVEKVLARLRRVKIDA
jgi:aspartyl-tRNA(Asn)/glutamyl-tRNA(Gln) amidotransferase subunit A